MLALEKVPLKVVQIIYLRTTSFEKKIKSSLLDYYHLGKTKMKQSMIQFFRKIRRNLLKDKNFSKYLLYAVGEILLVVIGILIALRINNWNESIKDLRAENEALVNLLYEFDRNQMRLQRLMDRGIEVEKDYRTYIKLITNDTIPVSQKIMLNPPGTPGETWGVTNSVLNSLLNSGGIDRIKNDSLRLLLTNWPNMVERYRKQEDNVRNRMQELRNYKITRVPETIPNESNYKEGWPGKYYPNKVQGLVDSFRIIFINDMRYHNHMANVTTNLFLKNLESMNVKQEYQKISRLIIEELKGRNIEIPER
jgi:hypothetical protein